MQPLHFLNEEPSTARRSAIPWHYDDATQGHTGRSRDSGTHPHPGYAADTNLGMVVHSPRRSRMPLTDTFLTWPDGSYRGMEPQCADCVEGRGRYVSSPKRKDPRPLDRYLDEIGPVPSGALKFYYALHGVIDLACIDALIIGAPIRNWEPIFRMIGFRREDGDDDGAEPKPIPDWRMPTVYPNDVYVQYAKRFGHRPGARVRKYAPPTNEPDAFDRALEAAIATGEPIRDWLSLETVRRVTPPTKCGLHGTALALGYATSESIDRPDPLGEWRRFAPQSYLVVRENWEFHGINGIKVPVACCPECRDEEMRPRRDACLKSS